MKNRGQSLFEIVIAIGLIALVLFALANLLAQGQKNTNIANDIADRSRAVTQANEWLRSQRDADWSEFLNSASVGGSDYCLNTLPADISSMTSGNCTGVAPEKSYSRQITLTQEASDTLKADIEIVWTDSQGTHTQTFTSYFTDWKGR